MWKILFHKTLFGKPYSSELRLEHGAWCTRSVQFWNCQEAALVFSGRVWSTCKTTGTLSPRSVSLNGPVSIPRVCTVQLVSGFQRHLEYLWLEWGLLSCNNLLLRSSHLPLAIMKRPPLGGESVDFLKAICPSLLLSRFSRVQLCATPETAAHQALLPLGFSRQEHWSGLPFPCPMHESEKWKWSRSVVSDS